MLLCSFISYCRKNKCENFNILSSHYDIYPRRGESVPKSTADMHRNPDNRNPTLCGQGGSMSIKKFAFCILYF